MTTDANDGFLQTLCVGGETEIDFDFTIYAAADLQVLETDADGIITELVLNTDYSVPAGSVGLNDPEGGTITLLPGPYPTGATAGHLFSCRSNAAEKRVTDFQQGGDFFAATLNEQLDYQTLLLQQHRRDIDKSVRVSLDSTITDLFLQDAPQDGYGLVWDGTDGLFRNTTTSMALLETYGAGLYAIASDITTVAGISASVSTVAGISANVTTVAGIHANVTTVAGISANVTTVAGISANVTTVAGISAAVSTVAGIATAVSGVNAIATQVSGVYTIRTDVTTVSGIAAAVSNVSSISAAVSTVSGISANVTTVAGISGNVTTVAGISANVTTVAGISANVTTVAGISANVTTVAGVSTAVSTVATNITSVTDAANAVNTSLMFTFASSTSMADPGAGLLRLNNATPASVTAIAIDDTTAQSGNPDVSAYIISWDDSTNTNKGTLRITKAGTPSTFAIYTITGLTDNVGWSQLAVTYVTGNGTFTAADTLYLGYERSGDMGTAGASGSVPIATAGGTTDAITADYSPDIALTNLQVCAFVSSGANTLTNPTFQPDGLTARTITKLGGTALVAGDIGPAGTVHLLEYNLANTRWDLLNPAKTPAANLTGTTLASTVTASSLTSFGASIALGTPASGVLTNCSGTAASLTAGNATKLATARNINGVAFDGSAAITVSGGYRALSGTDTVVATDNGKTLTVSGTCALALTAAATIGAFSCFVQNTATTGIQIITITPNGAENLDGANSTLVILPGETRELNCNATAWTTAVVTPFKLNITTTASPTLPRTGYQGLYGQLWGGGASGGAGATNGGGGGGGGGYNQFTLMNGTITVASLALTCTIGAGGLSQTSANTAGNAGGLTSVVTGASFQLSQAYGGGAGGGSTLGAGGGGGSIGGNATTSGQQYSTLGVPTSTGVGGNAATTTFGQGGLGPCGFKVATSGNFNTSDIWAGGAGGDATNKPGGSGYYAGAGGGVSVAVTGAVGGNSVYGGAGGGGASSGTGGAGGGSVYGGAGGAGGSNGTGSNGAVGGGGGGGAVGTGGSGAGGGGRIILVGIC